MKHKKQKKTKKAGRILLAVFAVLIGTLGVLLFTSERWMRKTWPNLSMEELVYQLKAPIAGTSHDLLMSYVCSSALIAAAALILLILVSIFLREKRAGINERTVCETDSRVRSTAICAAGVTK